MALKTVIAANSRQFPNSLMPIVSAEYVCQYFIPLRNYNVWHLSLSMMKAVLCAQELEPIIIATRSLLTDGYSNSSSIHSVTLIFEYT